MRTLRVELELLVATDENRLLGTGNPAFRLAAG
jgi:hypothetical protein